MSHASSSLFDASALSFRPFADTRTLSTSARSYRPPSQGSLVRTGASAPYDLTSTSHTTPLDMDALYSTRYMPGRSPTNAIGVLAESPHTNSASYGAYQAARATSGHSSNLYSTGSRGIYDGVFSRSTQDPFGQYAPPLGTTSHSHGTEYYSAGANWTGPVRERGHSLPDASFTTLAPYRARPSIPPRLSEGSLMLGSPSVGLGLGLSSHSFTSEQAQIQVHMSRYQQQPSYYGLIRTASEAIKLLAACDLPSDTPNNPPRRIPRRLLDSERAALVRSGNVFVWDEAETGIRRWTDGRVWSASRVHAGFLTYRELLVRKHRNGAPGCPTQNKYKVDGLIKQSFTTTTTSGRKLHIISYYYKRDLREGNLRRVDDDDRFTNAHGTGWPVVVDEAEYPDPLPADLLNGQGTEKDTLSPRQETSGAAGSRPHHPAVAQTSTTVRTSGPRAGPSVPPGAFTGSAAEYAAPSLSKPATSMTSVSGWHEEVKPPPSKRARTDRTVGEAEYALLPRKSFAADGVDGSKRPSLSPARCSSQSTMVDAYFAPGMGSTRPDQSAAGALLSMAKDDGPRSGYALHAGPVRAFA